MAVLPLSRFVTNDDSTLLTRRVKGAVFFARLRPGKHLDLPQSLELWAAFQRLQPLVESIIHRNGRIFDAGVSVTPFPVKRPHVTLIWVEHHRHRKGVKLLQLSDSLNIGAREKHRQPRMRVYPCDQRDTRMQ